MRRLLIANYFYPFNHSGAMRWTHLGQFLEFDVLTQFMPRGSFIDETLPYPYKARKISRYGIAVPAFIWGLFASLVVQFYKYDVYIFTCPPHTLLVGAYLLQKRKKKVIVDMRDALNSWGQAKQKPFIPLYQCLYLRMKNRVVVAWFIDHNAEVIYSGYDEVDLLYPDLHWQYTDGKRKPYREYLANLSLGRIPFFEGRNDKPMGYGCSSFVTLRKLGFKNLPFYFHPEVYSMPIMSWSEISKQYDKYEKSR